MTFIELIQKINEAIGGGKNIVLVVILLILSLIQISPIRLNPWTYLHKLLSKALTSIGRYLMSDVIDKVYTLDKKVDKLSNVIDENEIERIRWEILSLASSCQRGVNHTQREFIRVFNLNKKYHDILKRTHGANGEVDREIEYLEFVYKEKESNNSFL